MRMILQWGTAEKKVVKRVAGIWRRNQAERRILCKDLNGYLNGNKRAKTPVTSK